MKCSMTGGQVRGFFRVHGGARPLLMSALLAGVFTLITPMTAGCNKGGGGNGSGSKSSGKGGAVQASGGGGAVQASGGGGETAGGTQKAPANAAKTSAGNNRGIPPASVDLGVETTTVKAREALTIRASVPMKQVPATLTKIFSRVHKYLAARKIKATGEPFMYFPALPKSAGGTVIFQAGYPVPGGTAGEGEIKSTTRPGGKVAFLSYSGSSDAAVKAHHAVAVWMREKSVTPKGVAWEIYRGVNVDKPSRKVSATIYYLIK